jgi:uncharacterized protein involved in exopolysaccharide biosynthesis
MSIPRFDLVDVTQTLKKHIRFILIVTVVTALLGAVFSLIRKKKYEGKADFIMSNPLYTDRNNLFRANEMRFVDYFGGDDDIDRIMIIAESDTVRNMVAKKLNLGDAYKLNLSEPKDQQKLKDIFKKNYKIDRTEYKTCEVFYVDTDPARAAAVTNESINAMESVFRGYYIGMRGKVHHSITEKIGEMDSTINVLTDTLAALRNQYNIYDIISPGRQNTIMGSIKGGSGNVGMAVEQIQNIESVKDQLVIDRAKYVSLLNEFSTGNKTNDMRFIQVISAAVAPVDPKGLWLPYMIIGCALIGFFFAAVYILITVYYRLLIAVER